MPADIRYSSTTKGEAALIARDRLTFVEIVFIAQEKMEKWISNERRAKKLRLGWTRVITGVKIERVLKIYIGLNSSLILGSTPEDLEHVFRI